MEVKAAHRNASDPGDMRMHRLTTRWGLTGALIANRSVVVPHTRKELAHGPVSGKGNYGDLVREKGGDVTVCPIREFLLFSLFPIPFALPLPL